MNARSQQNLKEILPLLEGMEYFVFYGTLLGLVREGDILEKDDDIDLLVDRKHFAELIEKFNMKKSSGSATRILQEFENKDFDFSVMFMIYVIKKICIFVKCRLS